MRVTLNTKPASQVLIIIVTDGQSNLAFVRHMCWAGTLIHSGKRTVHNAVICRHATMSWHTSSSKIPLLWGILIHDSFDLHESAIKWHHNRFSSPMCPTHTQTHRPCYVLHLVAIGHICALCACNAA